jgi:hypothetical protein
MVKIYSFLFSAYFHSIKALTIPKAIIKIILIKGVLRYQAGSFISLAIIKNCVIKIIIIKPVRIIRFIFLCFSFKGLFEKAFLFSTFKKFLIKELKIEDNSNNMPMKRNNFIQIIGSTIRNMEYI